jgi:hypothetical protein
MPSVHYGHLLKDDLLELWNTEICKFYRKRLQNRVEAHDSKIIDSLIGSSSNREKILQAAKDAMPEAPEGCKVCHYLFNI